MKKLLLCLLLLSVPVHAEELVINWSHDAHSVYDNGFMHMLMKGSSGSVQLFDMELIQNDAPGAGTSEKGVCSDVVWGQNRGRKIVMLDDIRAKKAFVVFWVYRQGNQPLHFTVNGNEFICENWQKEVRETYRWIEFPVDWLKKGRNIIEFGSPGCKTEAEGWELYMARADEFEAGGGDPADVGKTSFKSVDGGESWKESPFGPLGQTRAEYTVRLSFDRFVSQGWLATPVIDLWKGDSTNFISRQHIIRNLTVKLNGEVPPDTQLEYFFRKGVNPNPFDENWEPYQLIGSGDTVDLEIPGDTINRRYVQLRVVFTTQNPLVSPKLKTVNITSTLQEPFPIPLHKNIFVLETDNPSIKYPSVEWEWESWDRPEFKELRSRENTDILVEQSLSDFDAQIKLLDYATKRWRWQSPIPEYPDWNALAIAKRIDSMGGGGMCIQSNLFLGGLCMAYGWQTRLVNIVGHEICEVWNDDYGKWIYLDASTVNHYTCDKKSGEPLNMHDMHMMFVDRYFPDKPIDWMKDPTSSPKVEEDHPVLLGSIDFPAPQRTSHNGFNHAIFMRIMPRNNYYEKPYPRPLTHGSSWWPWDGYINWYDDQTPPKRQYSWHTDRKRDMWPDLNLVHIDATQGFGNDRLYLRFETYTPNFSHFEVDMNGRGWEKVESDHWTWYLASGYNNIRVRAVNKLGAKGRPSTASLNHIDMPLGEFERPTRGVK